MATREITSCDACNKEVKSERDYSGRTFPALYITLGVMREVGDTDPRPDEFKKIELCEWCFRGLSVIAKKLDKKPDAQPGTGVNKDFPGL